MFLMALGVNHQLAPVSVREQFARVAGEPTHVLSELIGSDEIVEGVVLSTCNRSELYLRGSSIRPIWHWAQRQNLPWYQVNAACTYALSHRQAVKHLMRVASGLDSMVLGEVEILGQLKHAYQAAADHGHVGKCLGRLFQQAFSVAKAVRTETAISVNPVSVASLAVRLAGQIFADLASKTVLVIGAGDTARLVLKHFCAEGVAQVMIANRSPKPLLQLQAALPSHINVTALQLKDLPEALARADVVVGTTASPLPLIGKGMVERALKARRRRPMFMVDLALPRDIEPEVANLTDVYLYDLDDVQNIANENQQSRQMAAIQAESIVSREVDNFIRWWRAQDMVGSIRAFRADCEAAKQQAMLEALAQLETGRDPVLVLQRLAHVLTNRLAHVPTKVLREAGLHGNPALIAWLRQLYQLGDEPQLVKKLSINESIDSGKIGTSD